MKPYYEHGGITIYHGDCREILPAIGSGAILLVADPPYGTGAYGSDVEPDYASMPTGRAAIFGYPETLFRWAMHRGIPDEWIVWWPVNGALRGAFHNVAIQRETEHIAIWGDVLGNARQPKSTDAIDPLKYCKAADRKASDVWRDPSPGLGFNSHIRLHVNEKPCPVMVRLISLLGGSEIIMDPFMGSGTTLRAAKDLGRRAIGIEIEERYCEIAAKRLSQEVLFTEERAV